MIFNIRRINLCLVIMINYQFVSGQYLSLGFCPKVFGMKNFNVTKYMGTWYEVENYPFVFEVSAACVQTDYYENEDGSFSIDISLYEKLMSKSFNMPGLTTIIGRNGEAQVILDLLITLSPIPFRVKFPYVLVDTDYTSYAIKFHCQQMGLMNYQFMWILSRNRTMSVETRKQVYTKLAKLGIDTTRLIKSDQSGCPS